MEEFFLTAQKQQGRKTSVLKQVYLFLPSHIQAEFKQLPVDRQMYLLAIPLKKQARFKREGVDLFLAKHTDHVPSYDAFNKRSERRYEQRIQQHVANGGFVEYE